MLPPRFQRLGSAKTTRVDVRVIAATNRDLEREVHAGRFRADLFYRLSVFPIRLPALRERRDDIPLLIWHCITRRQGALGKRIRRVPDRLMDAFMAYPWPGNVRELKNVVERAVLLSGAEPEIGAIDLGLRAEHGGRSEASIGFNFDHLPTMEELQTRYVEMLLDRGTFSRAKIADSLGISERTVYRILQSRKRK